MYTVIIDYQDDNTLKYLSFYDRLNQTLATAMLQVQMDHPEETLISGAIDCDAAVILVKAMKGKSAIAKTLVLHLDKSCRRALADIKFSKNRVVLIFV